MNSIRIRDFFSSFFCQYQSADFNSNIFFSLLNLICFSQSILFVSPSFVDCKCVQFNDSFKRSSFNQRGKEFGRFTSPNWPSSYESGIDCLLYTFKGPPNHLVQLTFNQFNLQRIPTSSLNQHNLLNQRNVNYNNNQVNE